MTDNRDIDEILASLDALLREGDSHNDDMPVEPVESTLDTDASDVDLETDIVFVESSVEEFLDSDEVEGEDPAVEAVPEEVTDWQEGGMSRVVLTEDMMVENPQVSLPLSCSSERVSEGHAAGGEASEPDTLASDNVVEDEAAQDVLTDKSVTAEESNHDNSEGVISEDVVAEPVMRLHKQEVEQLLALVSLDVSSHLQEMLPKLIKESLHTHLADMQHDSDKNINENNKTSDDK